MERVEQDMKIVKFNDKISEILIVDFSLRSSLQFRNKKTRKQSQNKENLTIRNKMQQQRNKEVFNDATENVNEMVADDPLAQFSFEQFDNLPSDNYNNKNKKDKNKKKSTKKLFSKSTKIRKLEKSKLVSKPVSRIMQEHNHKQYVQLHNKYSSVRVEVGLEGRVGLTHKELTKYCKYTHFNLFTRLLVIK